MKKKLVIIGMICILVISIILLSLSILYQKQNETSNDSRWIIKKVYVDKNDISIQEGIAIVPKWDEMSITQKFGNVNFTGNNYNTRSAKITSDLIDQKISTVTLNGYDVYTETKHTINAEIYSIKNFPQKCAIAVKFDNNNEYYTYINLFYKPETLGEFIDDLNLKEIVDFGTVWYDASYRDEQGKYHYEEIEFPDVSDDIIWKMLFTDELLPNVHKDSDWHNRVMSVSVNIPLFGYENISVSVSDDGCLTTNIWGTGKTFYIGKEKVQNFVNYVLDNYDGYKTIYVDENGNEIIDDIGEDEETSKAEDEIIMVYTNNSVEPQRMDIVQNQGKNFVESYEGKNISE